MTPAYLRILRIPGVRLVSISETDSPTDICPSCGWMRWEHHVRPEHCQGLT